MPLALDTWTNDLSGAALVAASNELPAADYLDVDEAGVHLCGDEDCDDPACRHDHEDCTCGVSHNGQPRACKRHGWCECTKCCLCDQTEQVELECGETFHPACVQAWLDCGEFTADDLAPWREALLAAGVVFPEAAPVASAAE